METVKGKTVVLRPVTYDDMQQIVDWRNSDVVRKFFLIQEKYTLEGQKKWMDNVISTGRAVQFIIHHIGDNVDIGTAYIRDLDKYDREGEYGLFIGNPDYFGKGIGTEVGQMIMEYAFNVLNLKRVFSEIKDDNIRSIRAVEKFGMSVYKVEKNALEIDGKPVNLVFTEINNPNNNKL